MSELRKVLTQFIPQFLQIVNGIPILTDEVWRVIAKTTNYNDILHSVP